MKQYKPFFLKEELLWNLILKNQMTVNEVKGLLKGLNDYVRDVKYNLSCDNLDELTDRTNEMRQIINIIERRVIKLRNDCKVVSKDELY